MVHAALSHKWRCPSVAEAARRVPRSLPAFAGLQEGAGRQQPCSLLNWQLHILSLPPQAYKKEQGGSKRKPLTKLERLPKAERGGIGGDGAGSSRGGGGESRLGEHGWELWAGYVADGL